MTFNLLLDLDDTLLDTNLDAFLAAYFKKLAVNTADKIPPEKFIKAMLASTQTMYDNHRASKTLEQVFDENFYPTIGYKKEDLAETIDKFYDEIFPTLGKLTSPRPEAIRLVEWAFSKGWNVSIATDPLFPRKAILHRLRWAGLAPEDYPFTLISDFQSFHFAKKTVAYFPEFLSAMGWKDEPVLMVGDSLERDVLPSLQAGIPVFWLKNNQPDSKNGIPQGWFSELKNYLDSIDLSSLKVNYHTPEAMKAFLLATPAVIHTLARKLPCTDWTRRPEVGEWSFLEVLCHMRDVDTDVNLSRLDEILGQENVLIAGQPTDQWAEERKYNEQDPESAFKEFISARSMLIEKLKAVSDEDWGRLARHTILGPTKLGELVRIMVDHDRIHLNQASNLLTLG